MKRPLNPCLRIDLYTCLYYSWPWFKESGCFVLCASSSVLVPNHWLDLISSPPHSLSPAIEMLTPIQPCHSIPPTHYLVWKERFNTSVYAASGSAAPWPESSGIPRGSASWKALLISHTWETLCSGKHNSPALPLLAKLADVVPERPRMSVGLRGERFQTCFQSGALQTKQQMTRAAPRALASTFQIKLSENTHTQTRGAVWKKTVLLFADGHFYSLHVVCNLEIWMKTVLKTSLRRRSLLLGNWQRRHYKESKHWL